jgi:purine-binding chemotaxis protein CheW
MTTATLPAPTGAAATGAVQRSGELQIVVFELGAERYGVDIATVYEIIRHQPIIAVPRAPAFVEGIINLRGRIIPVVDLRARLGLATSDVTKETRIVVAETAGTRVGLIVDGVSEVLIVPAGAIEPTPEVAVGDEATYLRGIAKLGERLIILLALEGLFGEADVDALSDVAAA